VVDFLPPTEGGDMSRKLHERCAHGGTFERPESRPTSRRQRGAQRGLQPFARRQAAVSLTGSFVRRTCPIAGEHLS
jgi:hypothetical protein